MQVAAKLRAIKRALDREEQITKADEVVFICPKCEHRKPKLCVNLLTDRFHCWVCDWKGSNLAPLLGYRGKTPELREYLGELEDKPKEPLPERVYDPPILPIGFRSLSRPSSSPYYTGAMAYLAKRGLGTEDILRWKLGYCDSGEYAGRIIIPSFDEQGDLNFVVGRTYYNHPRSYLHGELNKDIIWNDYMVDWEQPIVITEGPFDAFKVEENVIALQGSIMGSELFRKIVTTEVPVYFAMDTDAFKKQMNIIARLTRFGVGCWYVNLMGKKDVGEMTKSEFQQAKEKSFPLRSNLDMLRLRVMA